MSQSILSGEGLLFHVREEFQFHRCRNRLKHYTFVTEPHRLVDPVSSGVYVHTDSYRSGSSKAVMGGCLIEYTPPKQVGAEG